MLVFALAVCASTASGEAFPGAQGYAHDAIGGRGQPIRIVSNLLDSGPGSFRDAVSQAGLVAFAVGGTVDCKSPVNVPAYTTINGATAPGQGVQIVGCELRVQGGNVIIRYLRVRSMAASRDGIEIIGPISHVVLNHVSIQYQGDEGVSMPGGRKLHVSESIIALSAPSNTPPENGQSFTKGLMIGNSYEADRGNYARQLSLYSTLMASNYMRAPQIVSGCTGKSKDCASEVVGNVIFNWGRFAGMIQNAYSNTYVNVSDNQFTPGQDTERNESMQLTYFPWQGDLEVYFDRNDWTGWICVVKQVDGSQVACEDKEDFLRDTPFALNGNLPVEVQTPEWVYENAGATLPVRDSLDAFVVAGARSGSLRVLQEGDPMPLPSLASGVAPVDTDQDGLPDDWEERYGFDPRVPHDPTADADGDGFTDLEEYLNGTVPAVAPVPEQVSSRGLWQRLAHLF